MNAQEAALKTKENLENSLPQEQYNNIIKRIEYLTTIGDFSIWGEYVYKKPEKC